ncbi:hypothetical protein OENI_160043 [Oenococcus oeni]|nr:hypothetical protein OENI_160043 [Oenococcus oeni]
MYFCQKKLQLKSGGGYEININSDYGGIQRVQIYLRSTRFDCQSKA